MNTFRQIHRVLLLVLVMAVLASCVQVPPQLVVSSTSNTATPLPPTPGAPDVAALMAELEHEDAQVRLRAAYQLGEIGSLEDNAIEALIRATEDPDPRVRTVAAFALGKVGPGTNHLVSALAAGLGDENWGVRYAAARALGSIGAQAQTALPTLLDRLESDADENVRYAAAQAIASIGPTLDALDRLKRALRDDNWLVHHYAGDALKQLGFKALVSRHSVLDTGPWVIDLLTEMGPEAIPELAEAFSSEEGDDPTIPRLATLALARMGPDSIPFLEATLLKAHEDENWDLVDRTINALGYTGKAALPVLIDVLNSTDVIFSGYAVGPLTTIGPAAIPALVDVMRSGKQRASSNAVEALNTIGTATIPYVLPLLEDDDEEIRLLAVQVLGTAGADAVSDTVRLRATLDAGGAQNRQAAMTALQEIRHYQNDAVIALVLALQKATPAIQANAAESLGQFGPAGLVSAPALVEALNNGDENLRIAAAKALGSLGVVSPEVLSALRTASQDDQGAPALRKEAIKALGGMGVVALLDLIQATGVSEEDTDLAAIEAIGKLGPAAHPALPTLSAILKDGRPSARQEAAKSLGKIGPAALPELLDALQNEPDQQVMNEIEASLAKIGPAAVPGLVRFLKSQDKEVISRAVGVLSEIGPPAVPGLIVALRTEDACTRIEVLKALRGIGGSAFVGFEIAAGDEKEEISTQAISDTIGLAEGTWRGHGLGVKEALPFLVSIILTEDLQARQEAMEVLALIGPNAVDAVPVLVGALQDKEVDIRDSAAQALGAIGRQAVSAAPAIVAALQKETDLKTRRSMIQALIATDPSSTAGIIPLLITALHDPHLRRTAAEALGSAGEGAAPAILAVIQESGQNTSPELAEALHGVNDDLRRAAAYALLLNTAATKRIADDVLATVEDDQEDLWVRSMAATALEQIGSNMQDFWYGHRRQSPLGKTCPLGSDFHLSGGTSFDIYADGCSYGPAATAPSLGQIFQALVKILTGR